MIRSKFTIIICNRITVKAIMNKKVLKLKNKKLKRKIIIYNDLILNIEMKNEKCKMMN